MVWASGIRYQVSGHWYKKPLAAKWFPEEGERREGKINKERRIRAIKQGDGDDEINKNDDDT